MYRTFKLILVITTVIILLPHVSVSETLTMHSNNRFRVSLPNYFITGLGSQRYGGAPLLFQKDNQAKFRIGFSYKLVGIHSNDNGLHFGYTQKSFWNIYDRSMPFLDNNYSPELFLYYGTDSKGHYRRYKPSFKLGLLHESNGCDGEDDRSWDRLVTEIRFGDRAQTPTCASVSLWYPLTESNSNPFLHHYAGIGEVSFFWEPRWKKDLNQIEFLAFGAASRFTDRGPFFTSIELSAYCNPFSGLSTKGIATPTFMVQYFQGTGENLLNFQKRSYALRLGIAFLP